MCDCVAQGVVLTVNKGINGILFSERIIKFSVSVCLDGEVVSSGL